MSCIDFLPASVQQRRDALQRRRVTGLTVIAGLLAGVAVWLPLRGWSDQLQKQSLEVTQQLELAEYAQAKAQAADARRARFQQRIDLIESLRDDVAPVEVLALLTELTPSDITYQNVEFRTVRPSPTPRPDETGAAPRPGRGNTLDRPKYQVELTIDGIAPDDRAVVRFVAALDRHRLFSDVKIPANRGVVVEGLQARSFQVRLVIDLNRRIKAGQEGVAHATY
ncbi:MAG: hypothetical protein AAGI68_04285 [Planctomycetota bacterium]